MRILICTQPILGHVEPGLVIAEALRQRGHDVAWYTGSCMRERIEARGFRFHPIVKAFDYDGSRPHLMFPERKHLSGIADLKFILKRVFNAGMPLQVEDIEAILAKEPADVLLADFVTFGPRAVHERGGPVWAAFGFSALTLSSVDTAPYGLGLAPDASPLGRLRNRALRVLSDGIVFRDVVRHHDSVRKSLNLPLKRTSPMDTPLSPFLFLQGTVPEFEYPRSDLPAQVHYVGALVPKPKVLPFAAPSWWPELKERKRPVILVTQGTMDNTDLGELMRPTLRALRDANVTVVATTGRALQPDELGEIPANAHVEEFLPYHELLPYVDVMVTNGGYNGVLAALRNGVPLIVHGAQSDKPEIGARVDWSGAGVRLRQKRVRPSDVLEAITRVLASEQFAARAKALQSNFAGHDAGIASAELLERLAETRAPVLRA